jgi:hypothetical protein
MRKDRSYALDERDSIGLSVAAKHRLIEKEERLELICTLALHQSLESDKDLDSF